MVASVAVSGDVHCVRGMGQDGLQIGGNERDDGRWQGPASERISVWS